jgi:hypothetical protein
MAAGPAVFGAAIMGTLRAILESPLQVNMQETPEIVGFFLCTGPSTPTPIR